MGRMKRARFYMMRGHSNIALFISVFNFVTIQYYLLVQNFEILRTVFFSFWFFALIGGLSYLLFAVYIGWKDINKDLLGWQTEGEVSLEKNPIWIKLFGELEEIKGLVRRK